jgi:hypothetical protein
MANYIDNKNFLEALIEYKRKCKEAEERGEEIPGPSNYIGECLLLIGQNLSTNRNFAYYPFRDEMISDGYENCLTYLRNFDPEKSKNPFAYYTQITYYAFLRKIQKEKGILVGKGKYVQREFLENRNYATIDGKVVPIKTYSSKKLSKSDSKFIKELLEEYEPDEGDIN